MIRKLFKFSCFSENSYLLEYEYIYITHISHFACRIKKKYLMLHFKHQRNILHTVFLFGKYAVLLPFKRLIFSEADVRSEYQLFKSQFNHIFKETKSSNCFNTYSKKKTRYFIKTSLQYGNMANQVTCSAMNQTFFQVNLIFLLNIVEDPIDIGETT